MAFSAAYLVVVDIPRELELHPSVVERESVPQGLFVVVQLPEPAKHSHAIFAFRRYCWHPGSAASHPPSAAIVRYKHCELYNTCSLVGKFRGACKVLALHYCLPYHCQTQPTQPRQRGWKVSLTCHCYCCCKAGFLEGLLT